MEIWLEVCGISPLEAVAACNIQLVSRIVISQGYSFVEEVKG